MDWIPAVSTTSALILATWLSRNLIIERLKGAVHHEYDKKIEKIRTELRVTEESFRGELREKESQIQALRSGALSGVVSRQDKLYQRKLLAVEAIWECTVKLAPAKNVAIWMASIKVEEAAKEAARNPEFREIFSVFDTSFNINDVAIKNSDFSRPFLSPLVWALFSAYRSIVINAFIKMQLMKAGISKDFTNVDEVTKVVKAALPEYESYIDENGISAFHHLLDILETKIIAELGKMLSGEEADKDSVERAAKILQESDRLMEVNSKVGKSVEQPNDLG